MRRAGRATFVLLAAAASAVLGAPPAHADSAATPAVKTNWYWFLEQPVVNGETVPVGAPEQASAVPAGDLGVGYVVDQLGSSDKAAAIQFDTSAVPPGSTYSSFTVQTPWDPAASQLTTGTPDVSACELIDVFQDGAGPTALTAAPPISLPSCVKGTFKSTIGTKGGYEFDLTAVANDWSGGAPANGILLRPTPSLSTPQPPFSLALLGKNGIRAEAQYTPPQPSEPTPLPGPVLPPVPTLPSVVVPPIPPIAPQVMPTPAPQVNPLPRTVPPQALAAYHQGALVPSGAWWLGALALLVLLVLTATVLGDPLAPVPVDPRRRRFAEVVRAQTRTSAPVRRHGTARFRPA